jgi:antitoxin component of MazEF toxin-antitoxin module
MAVHRAVTKVGGSLAVLLPRDMAESMGVEAGSPVRLSLVNDQLVIEPTHGYADDASFNRAFAAVLRQHHDLFGFLAEYDQGLHATPPEPVPRVPRVTGRRKGC